MKKILITLCPLVLALASVHLNAAPLGTAFTYQGRLTDSGQSANGTVPMVFGLWDADMSGSNVGSRSSISSNVTVANGLFTIDLDFGPAAFSGDARWLEIRVHGTLLTSRQRVAPTPHALYASTAGTVKNGAVQANQLGTAGATAAGQILTYNGSSLVWQTPSGPNLWSVNGNNDAYYNGGNVGIGTTGPSGKLTVATTDDATPAFITAFDGRHVVVGTAAEGAGISYSANTGAGYITALAPGVAWKDLVLQARSLSFNISGETPALSVLNNGNVGIGTASPGSKLQVSQVGNSGVGVFAGDRTPFGAALFQTDVSTPGTHAWFAENGNRVFSVEAGGHLTAVRGAELVGNWDGGQVALELSGQKPTIKFVGDGASDNKRWLIHLGSDGPGDLEFFRTSFVEELIGHPPRKVMTLSGDGLHVVGTVNATAGIVIGNNPGTIDAPIYSDNAASSRVVLWNTATAGLMDLHCRQGDVSTLTIRGGADIAEPFPMKEEEIEKGSVVVIDDEHPGRLKLSTRAYDSQVAGIVSGANGVNPGISLYQEGVIEGGQNVALSGRVYVQADASTGPIKPGDLLTSSNTPGHAMKVTDHAKAQGAIIGKAMSALKEGKGMVLVLVTLQ